MQSIVRLIWVSSYLYSSKYVSSYLYVAENCFPLKFGGVALEFAVKAKQCVYAYIAVFPTERNSNGGCQGGPDNSSSFVLFILMFYTKEKYWRMLSFWSVRRGPVVGHHTQVIDQFEQCQVWFSVLLLRIYHMCSISVGWIFRGSSTFNVFTDPSFNLPSLSLLLPKLCLFVDEFF